MGLVSGLIVAEIPRENRRRMGLRGPSHSPYHFEAFAPRLPVPSGFSITELYLIL